MDKIQLLYVENVISRKKRLAQQQLSFLLLLADLSYDKQVDILWAGEDGVWHTLAAVFHSKLGQDKEYWRARMRFYLTASQSLPGNVQFGLRYRCLGAEYWDNNHGLNYSSQADSGIMLAPEIVLQNIGFEEKLTENRKSLPITVATDRSLHTDKVIIHWTTDNWRHTHKTPCHYKRNYWDKKAKSNSRNPNQYGIQIWQGRLKIGNAFRLQYSLCCESKGGKLWDNNRGYNYTVCHERLKILILNLHCNQEDNQDHKFSQIAKAINELNIDIVCFQEVAENWNNGQGDWKSNSAKKIVDRLDKPYQLYTDWSHLGFDRYREGVAILSKYPMTKQESAYVSDSHDVHNIHSRKVVMAQIRVPYVGLLNVFSAHLSWWEDGFQQQFQRLREWANSKTGEHVKATLLCGDFNITAGSRGYHQIVDGGEYDDQYLAANTHGPFEENFRVNDAHWQHNSQDDHRIDYIFMNKTNNLHVTSARVLFTGQDYGRVSDHYGYLMTFEPG